MLSYRSSRFPLILQLFLAGTRLGKVTAKGQESDDRKDGA
jgi:hypothetical protein